MSYSLLSPSSILLSLCTNYPTFIIHPLSSPPTICHPPSPFHHLSLITYHLQSTATHHPPSPFIHHVLYSTITIHHSLPIMYYPPPAIDHLSIFYLFSCDLLAISITIHYLPLIITTTTTPPPSPCTIHHPTSVFTLFHHPPLLFTTPTHLYWLPSTITHYPPSITHHLLPTTYDPPIISPPPFTHHLRPTNQFSSTIAYHPPPSSPPPIP